MNLKIGIYSAVSQRIVTTTAISFKRIHGEIKIRLQYDFCKKIIIKEYGF